MQCVATISDTFHMKTDLVYKSSSTDLSITLIFTCSDCNISEKIIELFEFIL